MLTREVTRRGHRSGFSLLEVQAAFIVLGFSIAALFPFAVAQLRLVSALEKRVPPNTTFVLVSRDNHILNLLAGGGGVTASPTSKPPPQGPATESFGPGSRPVAIVSVTPGIDYTNQWTAIVTVNPSPAGSGQ